MFPPEVDSIQIAPDSFGWLLMVHATDGTRYLFAYNGSGTSATVTWTFAEPVREVTDLDAARASPAGTTFTDRFAPYEVKRLRLK